MVNQNLQNCITISWVHNYFQESKKLTQRNWQIINAQFNNPHDFPDAALRKNVKLMFPENILELCKCRIA